MRLSVNMHYVHNYSFTVLPQGQSDRKYNGWLEVMEADCAKNGPIISVQLVSFWTMTCSFLWSQQNPLNFLLVRSFQAFSRQVWKTRSLLEPRDICRHACRFNCNSVHLTPLHTIHFSNLQWHVMLWFFRACSHSARTPGTTSVWFTRLVRSLCTVLVHSRVFHVLAA